MNPERSDQPREEKRLIPAKSWSWLFAAGLADYCVDLALAVGLTVLVCRAWPVRTPWAGVLVFGLSLFLVWVVTVSYMAVGILRGRREEEIEQEGLQRQMYQRGFARGLENAQNLEATAKPGRMSLERAENVTGFVIGLLANKPPKSLLRRSQLRGHSPTEIKLAFSLVIAKRRLIAEKDQCVEYADKAGGLVMTVAMNLIFVSDEVANKLDQVPGDWTVGGISAAHVRVMNDYSAEHRDENEMEGRFFLKMESLDSFNRYCWTLDVDDPLYWQKIYAHLDSDREEAYKAQGEPIRDNDSPKC